MSAISTSQKGFLDLCVAIKCIQSCADRLREAVRLIRVQKQEQLIDQTRSDLLKRVIALGFAPPAAQRGMSLMTQQQLLSTQNMEMLVEILTSTHFNATSPSPYPPS